ncbi:exonuclease 1-like [Dendronephthya gigantea]|uniref:exonuclease 1-like n=1 Tax=Dendronephthya gigantea TaxID=151771 RepID=UPI00106BA8EE|nr:exonuclease 1-like [Dendronephthya gigantea]
MYFLRTREESRAKALQLQNEGSVRESWKMLSQAASIEYKHVKDFIWVCIEKKVQYIVAAYESDAQIAFMLQHGHAGFAVTEDSDLLAYGCKKVFYKLHLNGQGEEIVLQDVLQAFDISQDKFLNWCILSGCDYLPNLKGIGIKKAKQIIDSKDDFLSVVEVLDIAPPDYGQKFNEA